MCSTALTNFPYFPINVVLLKEFFAYLNFNLLSHTFLENSPNTVLSGTFSGGAGEIFNVVSFLDLQYVSFSMVVYRNKSTKGFSKRFTSL